MLMKDNRIFLKIIVPLMIVAVVIGIWFIKYSSKKEEMEETQKRDEQVQDIPEKIQGAANNVPVQVIPTQVLFNADGTPFVPSEELQQEIEFVMYSDRKSGEHVFTVHQGGLTEEQFRKILKEMRVE